MFNFNMDHEKVKKIAIYCFEKDIEESYNFVKNNTPANFNTNLTGTFYTRTPYLIMIYDGFIIKNADARFYQISENLFRKY